MKVRYIDVAGSRTRLIEAGEAHAPKLLLLHGMALFAEVWIRNIDALAQTHHVVAVDMLGHGFTEPAPGLQPTIPAKLAHLGALTRQLGFESFAVAGSSYGALLGALLHLDARLPVTHLVITGSGSCFNTEAQFKAQVENKGSLFHAQTQGASVEQWRQRLAFNFQDPALMPEVFPLMAAHAYAQPWAEACWRTTVGTLMDLDQFRPFRILERLERISVPSLVTWGLQDRGGTVASAQAAVPRMHRSRLEVFDACAHYPMIEHADRYNGLVREFLSAG